MANLCCKLLGHSIERLVFTQARIVVNVKRCRRCKATLRLDAPGIPAAAVPRGR